MMVLDAMRFALSSIAGNKMRTLLTMFGIIVGISSVIMITAVGEGFQHALLQEIEMFNLDALDIQYDSKGEYNSQHYLTMEDAIDMKSWPDVVAVVPMFYYSFYESVPLQIPGQYTSIYMYGTDEDYFKLNSLELISGRILSPRDVEMASKVAVVNTLFAEEVFGHIDVVGEQFQVEAWFGTERFSVIGVTKATQSDEMRMMYGRGHTLVMPATTVQEFSFWNDSLDYLQVKTADFERNAEIGDRIIRILEVKKDAPGKYKVYNYSDSVNEAKNVILLFTVFLSLVAAISLFVGGIGVMNIMLVTVTERTSEIGIRKSIGASNLNIQIQFLIESIVITALGGVVGILLGWGGANLLGGFIGPAMGMELIPSVSMSAGLVAVGVSMAVGIIFGVFPASKAAKMDVIEALRFEA